MDISLIFAIIGSITVLLLGISIVSLSIGYLLEVWSGIQTKNQSILLKDNAKNIGLNLYHQAYWFSEDTSAMYALQTIAESLRDNGNFNISTVRDRWREKVKKEGLTTNKNLVQ